MEFLSVLHDYESLLKIKGLADILIPNHEPELVDVETIP